MGEKPRTARVLVVEDELLIRWSIRETLVDLGMDVVEAADAKTALRTLRDGSPPIEVVLLDFRLPDSNDLNLLSDDPAVAPRSQVILMTAFGTPEIVEGALALGVYKVLNKPFELHDMANMVLEASLSGRPDS